MTKKILGSANHFGSANSITGPLKKLVEDPSLEVTPIAFESAKIAFGREDLDFKTWKDYEFFEEDPKVKDITIDSAKKILDSEKPDLVFVGSSTELEHNGPEKALIIAAKEMGVPTLGVLDISGNHELRFKDLENNVEGAAMPGVLCVPDETATNRILNEVEGVTKNQLVFTGNPFYDTVIRKAEAMTDQDRRATNDIMNLGTSKTLFYIANGYELFKDNPNFMHGYWDGDNLEILRSVLNEQPDLGVGISLHYRYPEADPEGHRKLLKIIEETERMQVVDPEVVSSLDGALTSDIVATPYSTDGALAATAGRFTISMQHDCIEDKLFTNKLGATFRARTPMAVRTAINDVLNNPENSKIYCPNLEGFKADGKATERVVKEIYKLL